MCVVLYLMGWPGEVLAVEKAWKMLEGGLCEEKREMHSLSIPMS